MKIRIATQAWNQSTAASTRHETKVGLSVPWVEIDGIRTSAVIGYKIESSPDGGLAETIVTLTFVAAAEMVLLRSDGSIMREDDV